MKNIFIKILVIVFVFCTGCSTNDDGNNTETTLSEKFIGTWKPLKFVVVCSSGSSEIETYTNCEQTGRLTINSNGNWSETYFYEYIDNTCEEDGVSEGTWEIVDGKLLVKESGFAEAEVTFFEIEENILKVGLYDNDLTCDLDNMSSYYYKEYIKI